MGFPLLRKILEFLFGLFFIIRHMKRNVLKNENRAMIQSHKFQELIDQGVVIPPEREGPIQPSNLKWEAEKSISETLDELREDRV